MPRNVPDDWNNYYNVCSRCGCTYHESEGCSCQDYSDEEVQDLRQQRADYEIEQYEERKYYEQHHS